MWTDFLVNNSFLSILIVVVDVALCVAPYVASITSQCTLYVHCIKLENTTTAITLHRSPSLRSSIPSPLQEDKASTLIRDERQRRTGTGIGTDPWRTPTEDRDWTLHSWFFWKSTITKTNIWYIIFVLFNQECKSWFQTIQTISNISIVKQHLMHRPHHNVVLNGVTANGNYVNFFLYRTIQWYCTWYCTNNYSWTGYYFKHDE